MPSHRHGQHLSIVARCVHLAVISCPTQQEYRRARRLRVPPIVFFMVASLQLLHHGIQRDTQVVEWFSGSGHVRAAGLSRGMPSLSYEVHDDAVHQDFTSAYGWIEALLALPPLLAGSSSRFSL